MIDLNPFAAAPVIFDPEPEVGCIVAKATDSHGNETDCASQNFKLNRTKDLSAGLKTNSYRVMGFDVDALRVDG